MFLQVEGLHFGYPGCAVFKGLKLDLRAGLALVQGPESCGKTTLLRLLAGELAPAAGEIVLRGAPAAHGTQVFWQDPRSDRLAALGVQQWLDALPAQYPAWDAGLLAVHLQGFALEPHLGKPFLALSTGSRRKVLMAAALASGAALTLLDEPLAGLDKPSVDHLAHALADAARQSERLVVAAHHESLPGADGAQVVALGA